MTICSTYRHGFSTGENRITSTNDNQNTTGIGLTIIKREAGHSQQVITDCETSWVVMLGKVIFTIDGEEYPFERHSLFDQSSQAAHVRHLPADCYTIPVFADEHKWVMDKDASYWMPEELS